MRSIYTIVFLLIAFNSLGQKIRITDANKDFEKVRSVSSFYCLHADYPIDEKNYVATMRVQFDTIEHKSLLGIYHQIREKSQRLGGNSFRVIDSDVYVYGDEKFIEVRIYFLEMENFEANKELFYSTDVYLFGFSGHHEKIPGYKVKYNHEEFLLLELRYKLFKEEVGNEVTVKLGGMRGAEFKFVVGEGMVPRYIYFQMIQGTFYNSVIAEYNFSYGEFLKAIFVPE